MQMTVAAALKEAFTLRWNPGKDLVAIAASWLLVTGSLYTATVIVGEVIWGGFAYFLLYALVCATLFGVGFPLYWTVVVRKRPITDLGLTTRGLVLSLLLQLGFAGMQYAATLAKAQLPPLTELLPLIALALTIGFFEAVFWRGWVLNRLEAAFGFLPALLISSALYALYHLGYGMPASEMVFLFFIGVMFAVAFRLTRSVFILWPLFQPMGQLVTLVKDGLYLPPLAALGFFEVLILMAALVWLAWRRARRQALRSA